jgi:hypothetical protein
MHKTTTALLLATVLIVGCGGTDPSAPTSTEPATTAKPKTTSAPEPKESRPGDPSVYARIAKMTDCAKLQDQFDLAEQTSRRPGGPAGASWSEIGIAYMQAADERMKKVGCYG